MSSITDYIFEYAEEEFFNYDDNEVQELVDICINHVIPWDSLSEEAQLEFLLLSWDMEPEDADYNWPLWLIENLTFYEMIGILSGEIQQEIREENWRWQIDE